MDSPSQPSLPEVLDTREASRFVGLAPATLNTLRCRGGGPTFLKYGRAVRYRVTDLIEWRDGHARRSTSQGAL